MGRREHNGFPSTFIILVWHVFTQSSASSRAKASSSCNVTDAQCQMSVDEAIYKQYSTIDNSVKLFMSASHYCDLEFIPNDTNTTTKKKIKAVHLLLLEEIHIVLHLLHVTNGGGKDARECLDSVTTNSLKRKLESNELDVKGTKTDLQLQLFSHILDRSVSFPCNNDIATSNTSKTKTMVWEKGV
jgi:hypothetical protein